MKYSMTDNAKETRQNMNTVIINDLKNGYDPENSTFQKNMKNLTGTLYNPITQTALNDKKVLDILTQSKSESYDPRFLTFDQAKAHGMHVRQGEKAISTVNFTIEQPKGEKENVLMGRTVKYFNAEQVEGMSPKTNDMEYSSMDKIKLMNNLQNRMMEAYMSQVKKMDRAKANGEQVKPVTEMAPDRIKILTEQVDKNTARDIITMTYAMRNTAEFMGLNKDLDKEFLAGKEGEKGSLQEITPDEKEKRMEFREVLASTMVNREIGGKLFVYDEYLQKRPETAKELGEIYEKNPEKLSHDIQAAVKAKNMVKEKVMFMTRTRKSKEEIKAMEEEFKNDPKNAGKTLSPTKYYNFKQIDVVKAEDKIKNNEAMKSLVEAKAIETAKVRYAKTLDTQIRNMEMIEPNIVKISKSLADKIAASRKNLGFESDPKKFIKDYTELSENEYGVDKYGKETVNTKPYSYFTVDPNDIRKNNLTHEQILNKYANGKEGESVDIVEQVKADQQKKAEENAIKVLRNQAGKASRAKATAKAKEKQAWKKKEAEKAKTQTKTKTRKSNYKKYGGMDI